jgi:cystathionine gamma-synthase
MSDLRFETRAVRSGGEHDAETGALSPPIHLSTTFEHGPACETPRGFLYSRYGNPTQTRLEEALADLEGGEAAAVFASGLGAGASYLQALPEGSHVVFHNAIYFDFLTMARDFLPRWGMEATIVDMTDLDALQKAVRKDTRLVWTESPTNPMMSIVDIARVAAIAHEGGAGLLVDGTFATPALQRPLELGADIVLQSMTKSLGGHCDVQGGAIVVEKRDEVFDALLTIRKVLGSVLSPFGSWLVLRGLRSLSCRVERQSASAALIASALARHPAVEAVHYPGLPSDPGHEIAKRQMSGFGGMLSFRVRGGRDGALRVATRLKLIVNATSLGGVETLIEHRASIEGPASLTPPNLLRLSVGLEHPDDLIEDLVQALEG